MFLRQDGGAGILSFLQTFPRYFYGLIEGTDSSQKILNIVKIAMRTCSREFVAVYYTFCRMAWRGGIFCPFWKFGCFVLALFFFLNQKNRLLPSVVAADLRDVASRTEHVLQDVCSLIAALLSLTPACHFLIHLMKTEGSLLYNSENVIWSCCRRAGGMVPGVWCFLFQGDL